MKQVAKKVALGNGTSGLIVDVPDSSVVCIELNFRAGDFLSPRNKMDTAHLMEHLVLGANSKYRKSTEYSKEFVKNGAYQNASTGTYHMTYIAECAEFEVERIIDLLCVAVESPLFLEKEFKTEKENVREELLSRMNDHSAELCLIAVSKLGLVDIPYQERLKQLDNITLQDVKNHYSATHTSTNMRFIISGAIKGREEFILKRLEKMHIPLGDGRIEIIKEDVVTPSKPIVVHDKSVKNIFYRIDVALGHQFNQLEQQAFNALMTILLGTMHSRVYGKARTSGLVYGIDYGTFLNRDNQFFSFSGEVSIDNIDNLFNLFSDEFIKITKTAIKKEELDEVKNTLLGDLQRRHQTASSILDAYATPFVYADRIEEFDEIPKKIKAVKTEDVTKMAKLCFGGGTAWSLSFYGATDKININELNKKIKKIYG